MLVHLHIVWGFHTTTAEILRWSLYGLQSLNYSLTFTEHVYQTRFRGVREGETETLKRGDESTLVTKTAFELGRNLIGEHYEMQKEEF